MQINNQIRGVPRGLLIVSCLMVLFGAAEVITGFRHQFFSLTTTAGLASAAAGVSIGVLYIAAGVLTLTMKKWAAALAILCLALDVFGRIAMVVAGLYPIDTFMQTIAIILGTVIAAAFAVYIGMNWSRYQ